MSQLTQRNIHILKIIIEEYIKTGEVLWSKLLLKKYDLGVSSATVRNDMAFLESLDLIYQPYNSAGRLPTAKGLRAFVNYMMQETPEYLLQEKNHHNLHSLREFSDLRTDSYIISQKIQMKLLFLLFRKSIFLNILSSSISWKKLCSSVRREFRTFKNARR